MELWDNVRTDLRLRNITIYAQWASVLAAVTMYCIATLQFLQDLIFIYWILRGSISLLHAVLACILYTIHVVSMFVLPLAPLAIELPHRIRRKPFLYASIVSWFPLPFFEILAATLSIITSNRDDIDQKHNGTSVEDIFKMVFAIVLLIGTSVLGMRLRAQDSPGLKTRLSVNLLYCTQIASIHAYSSATQQPPGQETSMLYVDLVYAVVAGIFGVAAILYSIAWKKGHTWVSSVLLGGTGVEPMVLILPRRGHLYQSVGDEAREGAIRLV